MGLLQIGKCLFDLIDGSGYIFRAYYALPPLTRKSDGLPTGAVSGFCSMLFKLLEDSKLDQAAATFVSFVFIASSKNNLFLVVKFEFFEIVDLFFPPE
mgnify:CR=1 FL=1